MRGMLTSEHHSHPTSRVVMTGGGDFMGSHLLARMVGLGMSVTLIGPDVGESRFTASLVKAGDVRFVQCDARITDTAALEALEAADILIVSTPSWCDREPLPTTGADVDSIDRAVVPLARLVGVFADRGKHIVLASSDSVYGARARNPVRESDATEPQTSVGIVDIACEQTVRVCSEVGATASILRYAAVYGPGETASRAIPTLIRAALAGRGPVLDADRLDEERDYIHIADAIDATMSALRRRTDGIYNVGTGIGTTALEIANLVVWLTDCREAPRRRGADGAMNRTSVVLDTTRARSDLGFEPRHALPDGLKEEIGWFRAMFRSDLKSAA
jgi:nucleoside-diphosphate-sugar epimerase